MFLSSRDQQEVQQMIEAASPVLTVMKFALTVVALIALAGCAMPAYIMEISDSSVRVRGNMKTPLANFDSEAAKGCGSYGKVPVRISYQCYDNYCVGKSWLYACQSGSEALPSNGPSSDKLLPK